MEILILGSEGFIGSHAVRYFKSKGHKVYRADIVLMQAKDYFLINPERSDFSAIFLQNKFEVCINATGAANVQLSFEHPSLDYTLNTANVHALLDTIRLHNPTCKFINLSSAAVYGNPASLPIAESAGLNPLSPYGYHKLYSEQICKEFYTFFQVPTISVRIFSAYGEGLQKQIFWDLYRKIDAASDTIEMFGTGNESRDFIYIADLVSAIDHIIQNAAFDGSAINVASGVESTIRQAVDHFIRFFDKKISVRFAGTAKIGDPLNWRADISRLKTLGFENKVPLEKGIENYCKWVQEKKSR